LGAGALLLEGHRQARARSSEAERRVALAKLGRRHPVDPPSEVGEPRDLPRREPLVELVEVASWPMSMFTNVCMPLTSR